MIFESVFSLPLFVQGQNSTLKNTAFFFSPVASLCAKDCDVYRSTGPHFGAIPHPEASLLIRSEVEAAFVYKLQSLAIFRRVDLVFLVQNTLH